MAAAEVADGAARVYTDFQLHEGCTRFVLIDRQLTERQAGRTLQRLFEIEAYRMLALLAEQRRTNRLLRGLIWTGVGFVAGLLAVRLMAPWFTWL